MTATGSEDKDAKLRRVKRIATGLLVFVAALYVVAAALTPRYPALAYVAATCEAAMVGALADWFAVVALFRHPLGVPLPHTAIIPRNRERLARNLGQFIQEKFLSTPALVVKIRELDPAAQLAAWLLNPANAGVLAGYLGKTLLYGLGALDDERVRVFLHREIAARLHRLDLATLLAQLLDVLTENRRHHALFDQALASVHELLSREETREFLRSEVAAQMPMLKWVNEVFHLDRKAAARILDVAIARLGEVRDDPGHELRRRFDALAAQFVAKLKTDPALRARVDRLREEVLANPAVADYLRGLWTQLRAWLERDLARPDSTVHARLQTLAQGLGERLDADRPMRDWINEQILQRLPPVVETHRAAVGRFIERQINEWQVGTLVAELERNIGADLQYIRINGTLVGGAAGLAIYACTRLATG